jgi:hypothetical protein
LNFAKRQLLAYCLEKGIDCRPFKTFADIEAKLKKQFGVESRPLTVKTGPAKSLCGGPRP